MGLRLAFIGSIKDEILQSEELSAELMQFLVKNYPGILAENMGSRNPKTDLKTCGAWQKAGTAF